MTAEADKLMVFRSRRGREPDDVLPGPDRQKACQNRHVRGIPTAAAAATTAATVAAPAPPRPRGGRRRWRPGWRTGIRDERGAVAAELVIATPLLLLLVMGVIQFALWQHAAHVAEAAAQQALSVGRLQGESAAAGQAEGQAVLAQVGTGVLVDPQLTATKTAATTTVVVTGRAVSIVGLFTLPVRAVASGPSETLTTPGQGP